MAKHKEKEGPLAAWLTATGVSGAELGRKVGVSTSTICMWRWRKRIPHPAALLRLAAETGIPLEKLLTK
jgi:transcriptional regulator with XRE-family HTH domain